MCEKNKTYEKLLFTYTHTKGRKRPHEQGKHRSGVFTEPIHYHKVTKNKVKPMIPKHGVTYVLRNQIVL